MTTIFCIFGKNWNFGKWVILESLTLKTKKFQSIFWRVSDKELKLNLKLETYKVYVDDQASAQKPTPKGAKYDKKAKAIVIDEDQKQIDEEL